MFKKFTSAVTISALSVVALASVASASGPYADFTIANGDQNEEVQTTVAVEQQVRPNIQAGDDNDKPSDVRDYSNFTIANGDPNEEMSRSVETKVRAAITVGQPVKLNIGAGDDSDKPSINVGSNPVKPNIQGGDDRDMPTVPSVKLNIGASDPAEQA